MIHDRHYINRCADCGKKTYATKKAAKANARRAHPGEHMSAYPACASNGGGWHIGHLADKVIAGAGDRHNVYPRLRNGNA